MIILVSSSKTSYGNPKATKGKKYRGPHKIDIQWVGGNIVMLLTKVLFHDMSNWHTFIQLYFVNLIAIIHQSGTFLSTSYGLEG